MSNRHSIQSVTQETLLTPFKQSFSHASATREKAESLLVRVELDDGSIGFGESCPRTYVTGEDLRTASAFFSGVEDEIREQVFDLASLRCWARQHNARIDRNPAAWCAVELAILDAFARASGQSVEQYLDLPTIAGRNFRYSAVLDNSRQASFESMLDAYLSLGISDFKVKLSGDFTADRAKIEAIQRNTSDYRLRLDANNLWRDCRTASDYLRRLEIPLYAVEEPVGAGDFRSMADIASTVACKIILDESFLAIENFEQLLADQRPWVINLRVSKMGGLLRSLDILDRALDLDIPIIIGAQVGETSLLSRAALTLAAYAGPALAAQEGAFSTLLLKEDIFHPNLMFGEGGRLQTEVGKLGFGLQRAGKITHLDKLVTPKCG